MNNPAPSLTANEPANENLVLHFTPSRRGETFTTRKYSTYPFHVGRILYVDHSWPEVATVYLQSASGGIFQDDRLTTRIQVDSGAAAHVTTQGSTKVHSMERGHASEYSSLRVSTGGVLEYLVEPFILFPRSDFRSRIELDIQHGGSCIISDGFLVHSPGEGPVARFARFQSEVSVSIDGQEVSLDRTLIDDSEGVAASVVGMRQYPMQSSVLLITPGICSDGPLAKLRNEVNGLTGLHAGACSLQQDAGIILRLQARSGTELRRGMSAAWRVFRSAVAGKEITPRRK